MAYNTRYLVFWCFIRVGLCTYMTKSYYEYIKMLSYQFFEAKLNNIKVQKGRSILITFITQTRNHEYMVVRKKKNIW